MSQPFPARVAARLTEWARCALAGGTTEADLHDRRVAARRLRVACRLLAPLLPDFPLARTARRLGRLARALAPARTWDVHGSLLEALVPDTADPAQRAGLDRLIRLTARRRRKAARQAKAPLRPGALRHLTEALERLPETAACGLAVPAAEAALAAALDQARRPLGPPSAHAVSEALHRLRLDAKARRYTLELLAPEGPDTEARLGALRHLQDILGRHHDLQLLAAWLRRRARKARSPGPVLLGVLADRAEALARAALG